MAAQEITGIVIEKGTDFSVSFLINAFDGVPLDLTNYTAVAKIRKYPSSPSYKNFEASVLQITGYISLIMPKEDTAQLSVGRNYFDVVINNGFETIKVVKGTILVEETASV
jgi:hypothetical protein